MPKSVPLSAQIFWWDASTGNDCYVAIDKPKTTAIADEPATAPGHNCSGKFWNTQRGG